jgi:microcompartment protein CcmL/EutN
MTQPEIGAHLATLNLFREADGKVYLTVAGGTGAITESLAAGLRPMEHVADLVAEAAPRFIESWKAPDPKNG